MIETILTLVLLAQYPPVVGPPTLEAATVTATATPATATATPATAAATPKAVEAEAPRQSIGLLHLRCGSVSYEIPPYVEHPGLIRTANSRRIIAEETDDGWRIRRREDTTTCREIEVAPVWVPEDKRAELALLAWELCPPENYELCGRSVDQMMADVLGSGCPGQRVLWRAWEWPIWRPERPER